MVKKVQMFCTQRKKTRRLTRALSRGGGEKMMMVKRDPQNCQKPKTKETRPRHACKATRVPASQPVKRKVKRPFPRPSLSRNRPEGGRVLHLYQVTRGQKKCLSRQKLKKPNRDEEPNSLKTVSAKKPSKTHLEVRTKKSQGDPLHTRRRGRGEKFLLTHQGKKGSTRLST